MKSGILLAVGLLVSGFSIADDDLKRERGRANDAAKDAVEGKPAPELNVTGWINTKDGEALKLSDLKGKVVIIDFWGTW